jgi:putative endopeptidase
MGKKVGYPDKWRDFSNMNIDTISYFNNELEARKWWFNYSLNKLGKRGRQNGMEYDSSDLQCIL